MCFSLKYYYKDVGKNPIKNIENCQGLDFFPHILEGSKHLLS